MPRHHRRVRPATALLPACAGALAAVLLAGCVSPPPPPPPAPAPEPVMCVPPVHEEVPTAATTGEAPALPQVVAEGNVAMLAYADRIRAATPNELAAEINRLSDIPDAQRGPFRDLQLAVALGQTRAPQDIQRAQGLLQRLSANGSEDARRLQPLGRLLAGRYAEQRRVEDQLDRQNQQLRDSQRRIDQLNERLEAVRAIERSLTRSNNGAAGAAAPQPPAAAPAPKP